MSKYKKDYIYAIFKHSLMYLWFFLSSMQPEPSVHFIFKKYGYSDKFSLVELMIKLSVFKYSISIKTKIKLFGKGFI